jgi:hypothetical protein
MSAHNNLSAIKLRHSGWISEHGRGIGRGRCTAGMCDAGPGHAVLADLVACGLNRTRGRQRNTDRRGTSA